MGHKHTCHEINKQISELIERGGSGNIHWQMGKDNGTVLAESAIKIPFES